MKRIILFSIILLCVQTLFAQTQEPVTPAAQPAVTVPVQEQKPAAAVPARTVKIYNNGKVDYATSRSTFSLTSEDNLASTKNIMYKIDDGTFMEYKTPVMIKDEGYHTIYYFSEDSVGNKSSISSYPVIIDNTAPEPALISSIKFFEANNILYAPASAEFSIDASEKGCGIKTVEYSLDGSAYSSYKTPLKISKTGEHIIKYRAEDNLGNSSIEKTFKVFIDNNKPLVKIVPSGVFFEKGTQKFAPASLQYSIEAVDTESQVKKIMIAVDADNYILYESPITFSKEGTHIIKAKAADNVGNESDEIKLEFILDSTPPKVELKPGQ